MKKIRNETGRQTIDCSRELKRIRLMDFFAEYIDRLYSDCRYGTAANYVMAYRKLSRYVVNKKVKMGDITRMWVSDYELLLQNDGLSHNSVSFYLRYLRAVYNAAVVETGGVGVADPFLGKRLTQIATVKRAISKADLLVIRGKDLSDCPPKYAFVRDVFLFSFYTRGMSLIDMAYLRKVDIHNGVLTYRRRKTGQLLSMAVEPQLDELILRYNNPLPYVLPILAHDDSYRGYRSAQRDMNRYIKSLGEMLGFGFPLTFYVARHTWATLARDYGTPMHIISAGMGHSSEQTTRIYLAQLDHNVIDRVNRAIIAL